MKLKPKAEDQADFLEGQESLLLYLSGHCGPASEIGSVKYQVSN